MFKIWVPLPQVRPHWMRIIITTIYLPMVMPFIIALHIIVAIIQGCVACWTDLIVPCYTGTDNSDSAVKKEE